MSRAPGTAQRTIFLIIAALLIPGGVAGLSTGHHPLTIIGAATAMVAGLAFLRSATRKSDKTVGEHRNEPR